MKYVAIHSLIEERAWLLAFETGSLLDEKNHSAIRTFVANEVDEAVSSLSMPITYVVGQDNLIDFGDFVRNVKDLPVIPISRGVLHEG